MLNQDSKSARIRWWREEDCQIVCQLIVESAMDKHLVDQFSDNQLNEEHLRKHGFGTQPHYRCLVAELNHSSANRQIVGYALLINKYSSLAGPTIYLEDLFVSRMARNCLIEDQLLMKVVKVAGKEGKAEVEFGFLKWRSSALEKYKNNWIIDVTVKEEKHILRYAAQAVENLSSFNIESSLMAKSLNSAIKPPVLIRQARKGDCQEIYSMLRSLAAYHNQEHLLPFTLDDLEKNAFGDKPLFRCVLAELLDENCGLFRNPLIGYALFFNKTTLFGGESVHLENLYVKTEYRSLGIGFELLCKVAKIAKDEMIPHIDLTCNAWNRQAVKFYLRHGAEDLTLLNGWHVYKLYHDGIGALWKK